MVQNSSAWLGIVRHKRVVSFGIAFLISSLISFFVHFPDYMAFIRTPHNFMFMGKAAYFDPWDINVYVSAIRWGQQGHVFLQNVYTSEPSKNALLYPLYTISGYFFSRIDPFLLFHILSIVAGFLLCMGIYWLIGFFISSYRTRLIALFLIIFGGGFGWILSGLLESTDAFMTGFTFHSAVQRGHEAIGTLLYLVSLVILFVVSVTKQKKYVAIFMFSSLLLLFFYPYYLLSIGIIGILFFLKKKSKKRTLLFFLGWFSILSILTIFYYVHLKNSGFASVGTQRLDKVNIIQLTFGYGVLSILYLLQLFDKKVIRDAKYMFLNVWILTCLGLNFAPLGISRFFLRGLFFPIVVSVLIYLFSKKNILGMSRKVIMIFLLFLLPVTAIVTYQRRIEEITKENVWYYQTLTMKEMYSYLSQQKNANVLATYTTSNHIPALTGMKVYAGHTIQTPRFDEKQSAINAFYSGRQKKNVAIEFLKNNNITYIVYGTDEKELGEFPRYSFLKSVLKNQDVTVYKVTF